MKSVKVVVVIGVILLFAPVFAGASTVDDLLAKYKKAGAASFSTEAGVAMWNKPFKSPGQGQDRSCSTCHQGNLSLRGKHVITGKPIDPMAVSVNPKRLTDNRFIEKWFTRNCKWTIGRECTPQEKGNFLMFIKGR